MENKDENGGRGREGFRGRGRGRGRQNRATVECFKFKKLGHYKNDCLERDKEANYAEFNEEEELLLMAYEEEKETKKRNVWILDSGCSNHMCGDKRWFCRLDEEYKQHVKLGNNTRMEVAGKGDVRIKINGIVHVVTNVYFVSELKNNLLSIRQFQEGLKERNEKCTIQTNVLSRNPS